MNTKTCSAIAMLSLAFATPAVAQFGNLGKTIGKAVEVQQELTFTESEEVQLGSAISTKLRDKYGVVQDKAVHKYVSLVGASLASASSRPNLKWTFIVLDTDGINAFAAPGGFVHITRGALALIKNEAELAGVLGHEITHVTAKHTINAIRKSKGASALGKATGSERISQAADQGFDVLLNGTFSQGDEKEADKIGVTLANGLGYAPAGLSAFLTHLSERNKGLKDRSGFFASHPETQARIDGIAKEISAGKLNALATVAARYSQAITYQSIPVASIGQPGAVQPPAGSSSSGGVLGLSGKAGLGREKSNDQTVSSAGSRGVNPDRDAPGGPIKTLVAVSVTAAEIAEFRKGISG